MKPTAGATRRLFVAVPLPRSVLPFVLEAQKRLPGGQDIRLLKPEQLHVTLAFIGEVGEKKTEAARAVVEALPGDIGGECRLGGIVLLPNSRRARVIALIVMDDAGVLAGLFELVMAGLESRGVTEREERAFRAHVTIARMRRPRSLGPMPDCGSVRFGVESVCLYESRLRREGAEYAIVGHADLKMAQGQDTA